MKQIIFFFLGFVALVDGQAQQPIFVLKPVLTWPMGDTVSALGSDIDAMLQDDKGRYWFATNGHGVYCYDGRVLRHITMKQGLCSDFVWSIQQDKRGHLWFSTRDGFCEFNGIRFIDQTSTIKKAPFESLKYEKSGLFFPHSEGICFYNGDTFVNFRLHTDTLQPSSANLDRPYDVYSMLKDSSGSIWFGTQSAGVCRYDGHFMTFFTEKNLAGPAVRALFQDRKGGFWFGNNGGGLFYYDGQQLSNITEDNGWGNPAFLKGQPYDKLGSLARVWAINEDTEGHIWVGTIDAGVWRFDGKHWTNYTTKDGLLGHSIWVIYKDQQGTLWFVVNGQALYTFDGSRFNPYIFR